MVTLRVTHQMLVERNVSNLQRGMSRLADAQNAVSSGRLINKPSDDPAGTSQAMQLRDRLITEGRYKRSAQDGIGWLSQADSTMQSMMNSTQRARELSVRGLSTGAMSDTDRLALSKEIEGLRNGLLGQANTSYNGRPVFGGATSGPVAFSDVPVVDAGGDPVLDAAGNPVTTTAYVGDNRASTRVVGDALKVPVTMDGQAALGYSTDENLFTVLSDIARHVQGQNPTDHADLEADLLKLDEIMRGMRAKHAEIGTRYNQLEAVVSTSDLNHASLTNTLVDVEQVDLASASIELSSAEVAYQASMAATARVIQPSLASFLR